MLAKSLKSAEGTALTTKSKPLTGELHGETTWTKRRQGIAQAVGRIANSRRLIQLRKLLSAEADPVTSRGRPYFTVHHGKCSRNSVGVEQDRGMVKEKRIK